MSPGIITTSICELLHRSLKTVDLNSVRSYFEGKCVLITGAGGSIGRELARQVLLLSPELVVLVDSSEVALVALLENFSPNDTRIIGVLADVRSREDRFRIFATHRPHVVLHAAAYKHVPLAEANPFAFILNNIGSTLGLLDDCVEAGVGNFVLISTDKAVHAKGVMGATKSVCEILVAHYGLYHNAAFSSVRFGNVIGSSGSFLPRVIRQVESDLPVTITHPEMTRYFMATPEAVSLVLHSVSYCSPGAVAILKMGKPIKILDLAKRLFGILGKDAASVPIAYIGLRPGEKIQEELFDSEQIPEERGEDIWLLSASHLISAHPDRELFLSQVSKLLTLSRQAEKAALPLLESLGSKI